MQLAVNMLESIFIGMEMMSLVLGNLRSYLSIYLNLQLKDYKSDA